MNKIKTLMRKSIAFLVTLFAPFITSAQTHYQFPDGSTISRQFVDFVVIVLVIYLVIMFIVTLIKSRLDYRLKSKMIDKGVSEKTVEQYLQPHNQDAKNQSIKWFFLLAGGGIGLFVLNSFTPLGIHSIAIMSLCLSLSFLGYYIFLKRTEK